MVEAIREMNADNRKKRGRPLSQRRVCTSKSAKFRYWGPVLAVEGRKEWFKICKACWKTMKKDEASGLFDKLR